MHSETVAHGNTSVAASNTKTETVAQRNATVAESHLNIDSKKPFKETTTKERESHAQKLKRVGVVDYLNQNRAFAIKLSEICGNPGPEYVVSSDRKKLAEATAQLIDWTVTTDQLDDFVKTYWWGNAPPRFDQVTKEWGRYLSGEQKKASNNGHLNRSQNNTSDDPALENGGVPTIAAQLTAAWERKSRGSRAGP
jgi:hypothetical protein